MTSISNADPQLSLENQKTVTYWHAVGFIITRQIGAGIFSSPAIVNRNAGSSPASLIVWISTGFVAWAGAGRTDYDKPF